MNHGEIVDNHSHTCASQGSQGLAHTFAILEQRAFGDFDIDARGGPRQPHGVEKETREVSPAQLRG